MSDLRNAAQQALEALEWIEPSGLTGRGGIDARSKAITALRQALAEPEQPHDLLCVCGAEWDIYPDGREELVAAPTPRKRVELSDLELKWIELRRRIYYDNDKYDLSLRDFARAVIAKYEAKNGITNQETN